MEPYMFERSLMAGGLIALMAAPLPAMAGTINFTSGPSGVNTVLGVSQNYSIDGVTITATAGNHGAGGADFSTVTLSTASNVTEDLVTNNRGAGNQGLGV